MGVAVLHLGPGFPEVLQRHQQHAEALSLVLFQMLVVHLVCAAQRQEVGAAAVVLADVPADVTVVGMPAKIVRVHGKKDEQAIHDMEGGREYYTTKLAELREASHRSSHL